MRIFKKQLIKRGLTIVGLILAVVLVWLLVTDHDWVWPRRNYVLYQLQSRWWGLAGEPQSGATGSLQGTIRNEQGEPIAGAWIVAARWDGTKFVDRTGPDGQYQLADMPAGRYVPISSAPGYADVMVRQQNNGTIVRAAQITTADVTLPAEQSRSISPGQNLTIGAPETVACTTPIESAAVRRQISFLSDGQPNQPAFLYVPAGTAEGAAYPLLLTVYPGPADSWECASIPLAAAGYAVLGVGPTYSLDLDPHVDELERILDFALAGEFPHTDPTQTAALGGSYSGIHVQILLRRKANIQAAVLLGAPTDIFDMRRHLEDRTFIPPFGLDQVLIALGLPDRQPYLYWRNSGAYHVHSQMPPLLIIHSRDDEVVPIDQSDFLIAGLEEAGVPHQVHYFDAASHYLLSSSGESLEIFALVLDFLEEQFEE